MARAFALCAVGADESVLLDQPDACVGIRVWLVGIDDSEESPWPRPRRGRLAAVVVFAAGALARAGGAAAGFGVLRERGGLGLKERTVPASSHQEAIQHGPPIRAPDRHGTALQCRHEVAVALHAPTEVPRPQPAGWAGHGCAPAGSRLEPPERLSA